MNRYARQKSVRFRWNETGGQKESKKQLHAHVKQTGPKVGFLKGIDQKTMNIICSLISATRLLTWLQKMLRELGESPAGSASIFKEVERESGMVLGCGKC